MPLPLSLWHNLLCPYDKDCFMGSVKEYVILWRTLLSIFRNLFMLLNNAQTGSFPPNRFSAVFLASQKGCFWRENISLFCIFLLQIYLFFFFLTCYALGYKSDCLTAHEAHILFVYWKRYSKGFHNVWCLNEFAKCFVKKHQRDIGAWTSVGLEVLINKI